MNYIQSLMLLCHFPLLCFGVISYCIVCCMYGSTSLQEGQYALWSKSVSLDLRLNSTSHQLCNFNQLLTFFFFKASLSFSVKCL